MGVEQKVAEQKVKLVSISFESLNLNGLTPNEVIKELELGADSQNERKRRSSEKVPRFVRQQLNGLKKLQQLELLFDLYKGHSFWKTRIMESENLSTAAD